MLAFQIDKLSYQYSKAQPVISDLSLSLPAGKSLGLVGINGAGKSTLVGLLTGRLRPTVGELTVFNLNYADNRHAILKTLSLVPQGYAFYPTLSVQENVKLFASLRPDLTSVAERTEQALEFCQLENYQNILAARLSGGLQRRLNLAIGLVNQPKLLFLDEPTVGVDPVSREFILNAIAELKKQGISIVYTSHHMQEIELICDLVAVLHQGKILLQSDISELNQDLETMFLQLLKQAD